MNKLKKKVVITLNTQTNKKTLKQNKNTKNIS